MARENHSENIVTNRDSAREPAMLSKCFPAQTTLQYLKFDDHCHRYQTEKEGGTVGQDGR